MRHVQQLGLPLIGPTLNLRSRVNATKRGSQPKHREIRGRFSLAGEERPHWQPPFSGG